MSNDEKRTPIMTNVPGNLPSAPKPLDVLRDAKAENDAWLAANSVREAGAETVPRVVVDASVPADEVHFKQDGRTVGKIVGLSAPWVSPGEGTGEAQTMAQLSAWIDAFPPHTCRDDCDGRTGANGCLCCFLAGLRDGDGEYRLVSRAAWAAQQRDTARLDWLERAAGLNLTFSEHTRYVRTSFDVREGLRQRIDEEMAWEAECALPSVSPHPAEASSDGK